LLHTRRLEIWRDGLELIGTPNSAQGTDITCVRVNNWDGMRLSEGSFWRREWDSNPRYGFPHTRFPSVRLKPLSHLSEGPSLEGARSLLQEMARDRPSYF